MEGCNVSEFQTKWHLLEREYQHAVISGGIAFLYGPLVSLLQISTPIPTAWEVILINPWMLGIVLLPFALAFIPVSWAFKNEREAFEFPMYFGYISLLTIPFLFSDWIPVIYKLPQLFGIAITFIMLILNDKATDKWDTLNPKTSRTSPTQEGGVS
jgi:hypothetical protein